jgi:hypothetical protein
MLLHAMSLWDAIDSVLWPYAVAQAPLLHNIVPRRGLERSPYKIFTDELSPIRIPDIRSLFCPVYVLDARLQTGASIAPSK